MWPILAMGIIATGVMIERYRSLKMLSTDTSALRAEVADLLRTGGAEEALAACDAQEGPVPAVLSAGVRKFVVLSRLNYDAGHIEEQVVKAMDDYSVHIVAALERHLPVLATVSSVAPMLGFLGTVQGMIIAFGDIVARMGEVNIVVAAAGGIQTALLTTCFGLIVGIPAFIAYNYFTSVINRYVLEVEESATELIETVTLQMALGQKETGDSPEL
ncbi:MAG: MotA/TolQ/ExbB proton channel family protein [Planctomycetes bacterium]|nr:MotA/TolQ/ExbB proton channel family protein [Planctomycetota bacterium]